MKINFYPDHDNTELEEAAKEYGKIWEKEGDKIVHTIERVTGLKFKEKIINAVIYQYVSYSHPLSLQADVPSKFKASTLTHELCHRILSGNRVESTTQWDHPDYRLDVHKLLNLVLYDILTEIFGKNLTSEEIDYEISLWNGKGISPYKAAWDWALSMTKEQRQKKFKKYLPK